MSERFEIYIVYKRRYINTLPFLSFSYDQILVEIVVFERGWVTLSANVRGNGGSCTIECWRKKTTVLVLSCGVVCMILRLTVFYTIPACDRHTNRQTHTHTRRWLVSTHS